VAGKYVPNVFYLTDKVRIQLPEKVEDEFEASLEVFLRKAS